VGITDIVFVNSKGANMNVYFSGHKSEEQTPNKQTIQGH